MDKFVTALYNDGLVQWAIDVTSNISKMDVNNPVTWLKFIAACLIFIFAMIILTAFVAAFGIGYLALHSVLVMLNFVISLRRK